VKIGASPIGHCAFFYFAATFANPNTETRQPDVQKMPKRPTSRRSQRRAPTTPTPAEKTCRGKTPPTQTSFQREFTTKRRGEISELAFALAAARHGFGISRPYGDSERYDIILDPSHLPSVIPTPIPGKVRRQRAQWRDPLSASTIPRLIRVQVKSSTQLFQGLYRVNAGRRLNRRVVPYQPAEIDFLAAYIIPEDSWFILPLPHILGQTSLLFRPKKSSLPGLYDSYREAWPLLYQPDGLVFA
jgi:hypothetical protein